MEITISPIGYVVSDFKEPEDMPLHGKSAVIEVDPKYVEGLKMIEHNSHLWILSWFDRADRNVMVKRPVRIDPNISEFGVFALRTPPRPNPIALSLVEFDGVSGNKLYVSKYDAAHGTPVLDIKPYFQKDIVFSPDTPDIRPATIEMKREWFMEEALQHHKELCHSLVIGVRMAAIADFILGKISDSKITVHTAGSACLFDTLQGLSRGRFANPPRVSIEIIAYAGDETSLWKSVWRKDNQQLTILCNPHKIFNMDLREIQEKQDDELFEVIHSS
ncbi:tRNA (N6-threonylcarbamoyladenosine(37)-N6)-methyltransferase TrmO [Desulfuribacillus alkaliarsenatis]|uniref:tRNA (N6-threonylcarbamoyladenosine(37)-N6)-methyltransferase TrmO n=1 Tax=Desulfuribacillus alkaliarsenatis TaxID=766136 RepID=UPI000A053D68|nr:tRNA (N6-threonylcarbamoyladenosine(37)-N6)-methyltransferase TrmO [Desulfuribacillus alkaliarsenatis]